MKRFKKIYVEITNICNLNCSFCSKDNKVKREMSLDEFEIVLNNVCNYTDYIYLHVKGEPLIHSNLRDILLLCKKYNIKVNITTNGLLLKKKLNILLESGVIRQVNISLQSYENVKNDKYIDDVLYSTLKLSKGGIYTVLRFWALEGNKFSKANIYLIKKIEKFFNTNILEKLKNSNNLSLGNIFHQDLNEILSSSRVYNIISNFNNNKKIEELCKHCDFYK